MQANDRVIALLAHPGRENLSEAVLRHYGHTKQGVSVAKVLLSEAALPDEKLSEFLRKQLVDAENINNQLLTLQEAQKQRLEGICSRLKCKDLLGVVKLDEAVEAIGRVVEVLEAGSGECDHENIKALQTAMVVLEAVHHSQLEFTVASRLVKGPNWCK